jgi:hypothetical protein
MLTRCYHLDFFVYTSYLFRFGQNGSKLLLSSQKRAGFEMKTLFLPNHFLDQFQIRSFMNAQSDNSFQFESRHAQNRLFSENAVQRLPVIISGHAF